MPLGYYTSLVGKLWVLDRECIVVAVLGHRQRLLGRHKTGVRRVPVVLSVGPTVHISLGPEGRITAQNLVDIGIHAVFVAVRSYDLSKPLLGEGGSHGQEPNSRSGRHHKHRAHIIQ